MKPFERNVSNKFGAPMGRRSDEIPAGARVQLAKVPMVDGDYDAGGAYWGGGTVPLWCAWTDEGLAAYERASSRTAAREKFAGLVFEAEDLRAAVVRGVAEMMWAVGWADHAEQHGCASLGGCEITSVMPEIPAGVKDSAEDIVFGIELANEKTIAEILRMAAVADCGEGQAESTLTHWAEDFAERFGNDLEHMTEGSGVSWFDDHARFELKVPSVENNTQFLAQDLCKEDGRPACKRCGVYGDSSDVKCGNCGKNPRRAAPKRKGNAHV